MRSRDQRPDDRRERFGIPIGGYDRNGKPRVHYPDVLVIRPEGRWVAIELELAMKGCRRLEGILAAYGAAPRMAQALYFIERRSVATAVSQTATACGLEELVQVRALRGVAHGTGGWQPCAWSWAGEPRRT